MPMTKWLVEDCDWHFGHGVRWSFPTYRFTCARAKILRSREHFLFSVIAGALFGQAWRLFLLSGEIHGQERCVKSVENVSSEREPRQGSCGYEKDGCIMVLDTWCSVPIPTRWLRDKSLKTMTRKEGGIQHYCIIQPLSVTIVATLSLVFLFYSLTTHPSHSLVPPSTLYLKQLFL